MSAPAIDCVMMILSVDERLHHEVKWTFQDNASHHQLVNL